jgi:DNA-binding NarL/FixJ family response regulator
LKVVIADDSALIRKQLRVLLSRIQGLVISGTAEDGVEALRQVKELNPNVLVLDLGMPRKSGIEVLKEIRRESCYRDHHVHR